MGMRFQRRIRILPWVYLNLGKSGFSISLGPRGAKLTIGKRGVKGSVGMPGTGIRYETSYCEHGIQGDITNPCTQRVEADVASSIAESNMDRIYQLRKEWT